MKLCGQTDTSLAPVKDGEGWLETNLCPHLDGSACSCTSLLAPVNQQQTGGGAGPATIAQWTP